MQWCIPGGWLAVLIEQIRLGRMAVFCYLVADPQTAAAVLIDPAFETGRILERVRRQGCRVTHVINTHGHADHTAGNADIVRATGAALCIHRLDAPRLKGLLGAGFSRVLGGKGSPPPDRLIDDGDTIPVGEESLRVIHTPGHTPGGICLYTTGHLFTGDTLFVGAVGRADLPGGSRQTLLTSIRNRLYTLPENTRVWPGHDYGSAPFSTVGQEKSTNL
jgi:glyoxylase-like metal-dependent hydrolase (beta-lactamase superfamily II)